MQKYNCFDQQILQLVFVDPKLTCNTLNLRTWFNLSLNILFSKNNFGILGFTLLMKPYQLDMNINFLNNNSRVNSTRVMTDLYI